VRESVARWQPGREPLVPATEDFIHFVSDYEPAWEETFVAHPKL
jgi:hypothetical protein